MVARRSAFWSLMLVMNGGRERTKSDFGALLAAAGYKHTRIILTIAPQSIVEAIG